MLNSYVLYHGRSYKMDFLLYPTHISLSIVSHTIVLWKHIIFVYLLLLHQSKNADHQDLCWVNTGVRFKSYLKMNLCEISIITSTDNSHRSNAEVCCRQVSNADDIWPRNKQAW
jgi:hypothetical protein